MLNCTNNWQPMWHNKINYNIIGGFCMSPVAWFFLLHLHKILCSKTPLLDSFQTVFTKKYQQWHGYSYAKTMVLWAHLQRPKLFPGIIKTIFMPQRDISRVARAPTSATVKTNSLQSLQRQKHKEEESK